jgi:hypothetical protein
MYRLLIKFQQRAQDGVECGITVSRVPSDLSALRLCVLKKRARLNPARAAARLTYERSRKTTDAWLARMYNTVLTVAPY